MTPIEAPSPNCGFWANGPAGWVRLWLVGDNQAGTGSDIWTVPDQFYPLQVSKYAFDDTVEHPDSITFEENSNRGGYTKSTGLDEPPYTNLPPNVGFYATSDIDLIVTPRGMSSVQVALTAGDFYAQDVEAVGDGGYLFLVMP